MHTRRRHTRIQFLQAPQIHLRSQQRHDIRVERLPVRVVEVVLLALHSCISTKHV
jgi:hypothetical protein